MIEVGAAALDQIQGSGMTVLPVGLDLAMALEMKVLVALDHQMDLVTAVPQVALDHRMDLVTAVPQDLTPLVEDSGHQVAKDLVLKVCL